jgi:hypothetical protein
VSGIQGGTYENGLVEWEGFDTAKIAVQDRGGGRDLELVVQNT